MTTLATWHGADYAANTGHHRAFDEWFLRELPLRPTDRVLDLGCGSGDFTRTIADLVPDGHVVGLDAQPSMIDEARARGASNQSFVVARAQDVDTAIRSTPSGQEPFDLVYSRAMLHWVPEADHPGVLDAIFGLLAPGGWARIECGGGDNVTRLTDWLDPIATRFDGPLRPWTFLAAGHYLELLERSGFATAPDVGAFVRTTAQHRSFDRSAFIGWLTSQCLSAYEAHMPPEHHDAFRAEALDRVDEFALADGTYDQIFVRLDCLVRRPH